MAELVKNAGFNTYPTGSRIPGNWTAVNFSTTNGRDSTVKKEGTASVKIVGTAGRTKTLKQTMTISGLAGDIFTFSFWVKGKSIPTAGSRKAQVQFYDGTSLKDMVTVSCANGTYPFAQQSLTFAAAADDTKVVIKLIYAKSSGVV